MLTDVVIVAVMVVGALWLFRLIVRAARTEKPKSRTAPSPSLKWAAPPPPENAVEEVDAEDDDIAPSSWAPAILPLQMDVDLKYRDAKGDVTTRHVSIRRISVPNEAGHVTIAAWCHLRRASRTFLSERVVELVASETGEVPAHVGRFLFDAYAATPHAQVDAILSAHADAICVLMELVRLDGRMMKREAQAVLGYLRQDPAWSDDHAESVTKALKDWWPRASEAGRALSRLTQADATIKARVVQSARDVGAARTKPDPAIDAKVEKIAMKLGA